MHQAFRGSEEGLMNHVRILLGATALLLITTTAACGGGTNNADKTATALARSPNTPTAAKTSATGNQKQLTITARDFSFSADDIDVSKGDTIVITFKNTGSTTHTLAFYSDDAYKD